MKKGFMARTIAAHTLQTMELVDAANYVPGRERSLLDAYWYAGHTNYFERRNILVTAMPYNPEINLKNSFKKWLALQKHDVRAVNSLHEWRKAIQLKECELADDIYDLEEMAMSEAVAPYVREVIQRKEAELRELQLLRCEIGFAIDRIKKTDYERRATA